MIFHGWQANATGEDVVKEGLEPYGAYDITSQPADPPRREYPEFTWTAACDSDPDIVDVLSTMLWYNDRTPEQIASIRAEVELLLVNNPRIRG